MLIVSGAYKIPEGKRDEFMNLLIEGGIRDANQGEAGNIGYDYYYPVGNDTDVYFIERWTDRDSWEVHKNAPHVTGALKDLKDKYMTGFEPGILGEITE
jgi:quinol monooxygenase YgiN